MNLKQELSSKHKIKMKKNIQIILCLLVVLASGRLKAQLNSKNEFLIKKGSIFDGGFNEEPNDLIIKFNDNSIVESYAIIQQVNERLHRQWMERQYTVIEEAIENGYNEEFNGIGEAMKHVYKNIEFREVKRRTDGVVNTYNNKVALKTAIRNKELKEIKLLEYRKKELNVGIINSPYGHLKHGDTPLNDLKTVNAVNTLINTDINSFYNNENLLEFETNVKENLLDVQNAVRSNELYNHEILNVIAHNQQKYINSFSTPLQRLNLMQTYANNSFRDFYRLDIMQLSGQQLLMRRMGGAQFIESYAREYNINPIPSVFDFSDKARWYYEKLYGISAAHFMKIQREKKLKELLDKIKIDDLLEDAAINGLGDVNKQFLIDRPDLYNEVIKYFKVNDYSKVSHDCINYLLNQLQDGKEFAPDINLYRADGAPILASSNSENRILKIKLNSFAIKEGFKHFGNVLSQLFKENDYVRYEGYIIRNILTVNDITIPKTDENDLAIGYGYNFSFTDNGYIDIENTDNGVNPFFGADCRSFEYSSPPGFSRRGCGVTNMSNTFYGGGITPNGGFFANMIEISYEKIYFTMPNWMRNGEAANKTATAVTAALRATSAYIVANPKVSKQQLGNVFENSLRTSLAVFGGRMHLSEPFSIRSPAPYISSLFGAETDCQ